METHNPPFRVQKISEFLLVHLPFCTRPTVRHRKIITCPDQVFPSKDERTSGFFGLWSFDKHTSLIFIKHTKLALTARLFLPREPCFCLALKAESSCWFCCTAISMGDIFFGLKL